MCLLLFAVVGFFFVIVFFLMYFEEGKAELEGFFDLNNLISSCVRERIS